MFDNPFFDKREEFETDYSKNMPHREQTGKMQYVTFRLADSLPQSKLAGLRDLKRDFEAKNPKPWSDDTKLQFYRLITPLENKLLDCGYGSCVLALPQARNELAKVLHRFDGTLYSLISYVIMPNHVHLLAVMAADITLKDVMSEIWQRSTFAINRTIGRSGALWMKDYFDRLVRNEENFKHIIKYIHNNPNNLPPTAYTLYRNSSLVDPFGNLLR